MKNTIPIEALAKNTLPTWLRGDDNIVFCSTVCINRNIKGTKFPAKSSPDELKDICLLVGESLSSNEKFSDYRFDTFKSLTGHQRRLLFERRISSVGIKDENILSRVMLFLSADEQESILLNVNDHLEIKVCRPGFNIEQCLSVAKDLLKQLKLDFAKTDPFGYLTASPAISGTGMTAEVLMHIPGLMLTEEDLDWINIAKNEGVLPDGFFGPGTQPLGNTFAFINKNTHRQSEEDMVGSFGRSINAIRKLEVKARDGMDVEDKKDTVARAYGTMRYAQKIDFSEAMSALSLLFLGVDSGFIQSIGIEKLKQLTSCIFPTHLQNLTLCAPDEINSIRAKIIRNTLSKKTTKDKE